MAKDEASEIAPGWAPYWLPMLSFFAVLLLELWAPPSTVPLLLVLRAAAPLGFLVYFARRGSYPELGGRWQPAQWPADVAVGLVGAAVWVAPFLVWDGLRPDEPGFDPKLLGAQGVAVALALRAIGYVGVTPFIEELFVRSWMLRYVDVMDRDEDFRSVPIGRFRWRSFCVVTLYFVGSHHGWEAGVMFAWTLLTMAWFYHRKQLSALVRVHAVTNGAVFLFAVAFDGYFHSATGEPIALWFFL